jgi:hypothetical protein
MAACSILLILLLTCQCGGSGDDDLLTGDISVTSEVKQVNGTLKLFLTVGSVEKDQHVVVISNRRPNVPLRQSMLRALKGALGVKEEELASLALVPRSAHLRDIIERREREVQKQKEMFIQVISHLQKEERAKKYEL